MKRTAAAGSNGSSSPSGISRLLSARHKSVVDTVASGFNRFSQDFGTPDNVMAPCAIGAALVGRLRTGSASRATVTTGTAKAGEAKAKSPATVIDRIIKAPDSGTVKDEMRSNYSIHTFKVRPKLAEWLNLTRSPW